MARQKVIQLKKSKKTGQWYWVMKGANGEKMAHSEAIQNRSYLRNLMAQFESIGFIIQWNGF